MAVSINRRWRRVVLSSPAAWSRVWVHFKPPVNQEAEDSEEEWCIEEDEARGLISRPLPLWLQRSGNVPIHLSIMTESIPPTAMELYNLVLTLAPVEARLEVVTLSTESSLMTASLLDMLWTHAPMLTHLSIICRKMRGVLQDREKATIDTLWSALHRARSIKSLTCEGCIPPNRVESLPATGLTRLIVQDISGRMAQFLDALESCQHLGELSVLQCGLSSFEDIAAPPLSPDRVVVLQKLSTLHLRGVNSHTPLKHLQAPKLHSLDLHNILSSTNLLTTLGWGGMK